MSSGCSQKWQEDYDGPWVPFHGRADTRGLKSQLRHLGYLCDKPLRKWQTDAYSKTSIPGYHKCATNDASHGTAVR